MVKTHDGTFRDTHVIDASYKKICTRGKAEFIYDKRLFAVVQPARQSHCGCYVSPSRTDVNDIYVISDCDNFIDERIVQYSTYVN
jgi:hypothetical protein